MKRSLHFPNLLLLCLLLLGSQAARAAVPVITTAPSDTTICTHDTTEFTIVKTSSPAGTVKWQVSNTGGTLWSDVTDVYPYYSATTDTLRVITNSSLNGNLYRAIVTNADGADTSSNAMLTVNPLPATGMILGDTSACLGSSTTLSNSLSGGVWTSSAPGIATIGASSGIVTAVAHGFTTISYRVTNSCGDSTAVSVFRVDTNVISRPITGPSSTCVGRSVTLMNTNVLGNGVWTAGGGAASVSASGVVTGVSHGIATITYTFTNACNSVVSYAAVTVDTVIAPAMLTGATAVCAGSWTTITPSVSGGVWFSSSSAVAVVDGSGNVTGVTDGTAIISYLLTNACGASVSTTTITVSAPAGAIGGLDSVGIGRTRTLTNTTPGGTWTISDTTIAVIDAATGVATGRDTGVATVSYAVTNICGTSRSTLLLHVGPAPLAGVITGPDSVCIGSSITLADIVTGGVWTISNDRATISLTGVVTGIAQGRDTAFYTFTNGFGSTTIRKIIYVNAQPTVMLTGPEIVALGGNYFFRGFPARGTFTHSNDTMGSFVAFLDSGVSATPTLTSASYVVLKNGVDTIFYTARNTCGTSTAQWVISLIAENSVNGAIAANGTLELYPNPAKEQLTINVKTNRTEEAMVVITNVSGQVVKEMKMNTNTSSVIQLSQPAGIYFLTATTASGRYSAKITVAK